MGKKRQKRAGINWQRPRGPDVGQKAPDFSLKTLHGEKTVRLSDFKGKKPVVLVFGSYT